MSSRDQGRREHQGPQHPQEQLNSYLEGAPDDVFNWFAGYRVRLFAAKGLATLIGHVGAKIGGNFADAMKKLSKGENGTYNSFLLSGSSATRSLLG